jgi:type I restriction enzyme S subunit
LTAKHVRDNGVTIKEPQYVSEVAAKKFLLRFKSEIGDILICSRGRIGRTCVNDIKEIYCLMGSVIPLKKSCEKSSHYLSYFIKSPTGQLFICVVTKGMAVNALYLKNVKLCPVPITSLKEQYRIVTKVGEPMALCGQLESQTEANIDTHETLVEVLLATHQPTLRRTIHYTRQHRPTKINHLATRSHGQTRQTRPQRRTCIQTT